jgi:hypothetical protein
LKLASTAGCAALCLFAFQALHAQQPTSIPVEPPTPLNQAAVALDSLGERVVEATLRTTNLNGAPDTPVTNTRIVLTNVSQKFYEFFSGHVTFYDSTNVRCGEGVVKTGAFAPKEAVETDTPGVRITCSPASWRLVATSLVPLTPERTATTINAAATTNFVISIDGEDHPIQLGRPMVLTLADRRRTIVVRAAPQ